MEQRHPVDGFDFLGTDDCEVHEMLTDLRTALPEAAAPPRQRGGGGTEHLDMGVHEAAGGPPAAACSSAASRGHCAP
jgi:hypothetical protein